MSRDFLRRVSVGYVALAVALAVNAGCAPPPVSRGDPVRPIKTIVVSSGNDLHERVFPGKVEAAKRVELAFQVPGLLVNFPVKEGQKVAKGALIGQLRPDEFQARLKTLQGQLDQARAGLRALQAGERPEERLRRESAVRAAEAKVANARADLDRATQLIRTNAVSRAQFDLAETTYRIAQEELAAARQMLEKGAIARVEDIEAQEAQVRGLEGRVVEANIQLADTTLNAPYDGVIAQRFVEPNQNVQAQAAVVKFQDVDEIEVVVDVPETVMIADLRTADIVRLEAQFAGAPGLTFPLQIREIAQRADPVTQTFKVRAAMKSPPDINLLPGMTANVEVTYRRAGVLGGRLLVPITALDKDPSGEQVVFVIGADDIVSRRMVKVGVATGGNIEITDGLRPGDRIAVAGVRFLRDGMKVRDLGDALGTGQL